MGSGHVELTVPLHGARGHGKVWEKSGVGGGAHSVSFVTVIRAERAGNL